MATFDPCLPTTLIRDAVGPPVAASEHVTPVKDARTIDAGAPAPNVAALCQMVYASASQLLSRLVSLPALPADEAHLASLLETSILMLNGVLLVYNLEWTGKEPAAPSSELERPEFDERARAASQMGRLFHEALAMLEGPNAPFEFIASAGASGTGFNTVDSPLEKCGICATSIFNKCWQFEGGTLVCGACVLADPSALKSKHVAPHARFDPSLLEKLALALQEQILSKLVPLCQQSFSQQQSSKPNILKVGHDLDLSKLLHDPQNTRITLQLPPDAPRQPLYVASHIISRLKQPFLTHQTCSACKNSTLILCAVQCEHAQHSNWFPTQSPIFCSLCLGAEFGEALRRRDWHCLLCRKAEVCGPGTASVTSPTHPGRKLVSVDIISKTRHAQEAAENSRKVKRLEDEATEARKLRKAENGDGSNEHRELRRKEVPKKAETPPIINNGEVSKPMPVKDLQFQSKDQQQLFEALKKTHQKEINALKKENEQLKKRLEQMFALQEQTKAVIPTLKKIAKAVATQAMQLASVVPEDSEEEKK